MSARRVLKIMRYVASQNKPVTVTEISEHLQMPSATVYRLVATLENEAVLQRYSDSRGIEFSGAFLQTMVAGASREQICAGFRDCLTSSAEIWGATAFLGRLQSNSVEIVDAVTPLDKTKPFIHPGLNVRPAHACSAARALLAFLPEEQVKDLLNQEKAAITSRTITDREAVFAELEQTRERGYAVCDEEVEVGVSSVAAPVVIGRAGVVCSIGIVAATNHMHELGIAAVGEYLKMKAGSVVHDLSRGIS